MPSLTAVAANLVHPSPAGDPSSTTSASTQPNESFSSHLQTAAGKQARPRNSAQPSKETTASPKQESSRETNETFQSAAEEKVSGNRNNNDHKSATDTPGDPRGAHNQSSNTEYGAATQVASQQVQEEAVKSLNSEKTGRESVIGQMLSAISTAQDRSNTAHNPTAGTFEQLEKTAAVTTTGLEQPPACSDMRDGQGSPNAGIQTAAGTTVIFNPDDGSITMTTQENQLGGGPSVGASQSTDDAQDASTALLLVQNKYGQIITIEQSKESTFSPVGAGSVPGQQLVHQESNSLDFAGRFIHSHLPNETGGKIATHSGNAAMNGDQSQSGRFGGDNQDIQNMQTGHQTGGVQEFTSQPPSTSPLSFSYHMNNVQNSITGAVITSTEGASHQLGSGTLVPDSTVVDQITAHFSVNNRLETGTVNLKLHPQELGELRMAITIEHDNVKAHIVAQSPHAQEMIDRHMPRLREALEQQGLHLHEIEVTVADHDNAAGERFDNNQAWQQPQQSIHRKNIQTDFTLEQNEEGGEVDELNNNFKAIA